MWLRGSRVVKVKKVEGHKCELPQEEDLISLYINSGCCVLWRRRFRQCVMVDPANPESKSVLRSTAQMRFEESRHLRRHYHMIHPFSKFRVTWEIIMIMVLISYLIVSSMQFEPEYVSQKVLYISVGCEIICLVDIFLFFFTGYFDHRTRKVVMDWKKVFKHYILTYFIFDLLSSIPVNIYIQVTESYYLTPLSWLSLLKIRTNTWTYKCGIIHFLLWFFNFIWLGTNINQIYYNASHGLHEDQYYNTFEIIINCAYQTIKEFGLIGIGSIFYHKMINQIFHVVCIFIGAIINLIVFIQVTRIYQRRSLSTNKHNTLMAEIGEYMNYKELPTTLKKKIIRYVNFKFQKNVFGEEAFLQTLSTVLKQDVLMHSCKELIERVDFFSDLPNSVILNLITRLRSEIYLPGDVIVMAGIPGTAMYFIYIGTVAVFTSNGAEICHLKDGDHFGEISLIIHEPRVATVVAVTDCEVFRLSRRDFLEVIAPFPSLFNKIKSGALTRLQTTRKIMEENAASQISMNNNYTRIFDDEDEF